MLLQELVKEDFGISGRGRWLRSDIHSSLVIDNEKNVFYFNSRGFSGGPLEYLVKVRQMDVKSARELIKNHADPFSDEVKSTGVQVKFSKLIDSFYNLGKHFRDYWYKRGLKDSTIDMYRLGFYDGWSLIPIYDNDRFVNFQCRRDDPKNIRMWYKDIDFKPVLFNKNILQFTDTAYITEGMVDCILLNQLGFPCVCTTNGANHWNSSWVKYFTRVDNIFYIADNDKAGYLASKKVAESLGTGRVRIVKYREKPEKYDTVDFFRDGGTLEGFKDLISNSTYVFEV
jgi:DNA primase